MGGYLPGFRVATKTRAAPVLVREMHVWSAKRPLRAKGPAAPCGRPMHGWCAKRPGPDPLGQQMNTRRAVGPEADALAVDLHMPRAEMARLGSSSLSFGHFARPVCTMSQAIAHEVSVEPPVRDACQNA